MADKKINGSLEITGKLNPNASGYGFNLPSSAPLTANERIATEDYVDDALSGIGIGLNGKTYTTTGTAIELPDLAEVKGVPGNYPEYIDATVANGLAGKISWEELQASIDDGSINLAAHTFDAYITFYFPELLDKYGIGSLDVNNSPIPGYVAIYSNNPPVTMPDTVVDFATLKTWIIANIGTLVGDSYVDEVVLNSEVSGYDSENGIADLNIALKNGDIVCEARFKCYKGAGRPIVGATNPPTVPGLESTFVGEFRGDAYAGKITCDAVDAKTINVKTIGANNDAVETVYAVNIGSAVRPVNRIYSYGIGDANNKVSTVYAVNIGYTTSKVDNVYANNIGSGAYRVNNIFANTIGSTKYPVNAVYSDYLGSSSYPIGYVYATYINGDLAQEVTNAKGIRINSNTSNGKFLIFDANGGGASSPTGIVFGVDYSQSTRDGASIIYRNMGTGSNQNRLYVSAAEGAGKGLIILEDIPTSDPGVAGALWNDAGTLKISAGQQQA